MSVTSSPIAPRRAVSGADDPYKKYWWAILASFAFTGLWLLTPMMGEQSIGSTRVETGRPKTDADIEQSLASEGAGDGIDLSMDGAVKKKGSAGFGGSGQMTTSLYEPMPGDAASGDRAIGRGSAASTGRQEAAATFAGALKRVSEGGWGEKAQRGFNAPKLAGGSLSGLSAAGGGRAGSASGSGAFGARNAEIGFAATKSLAGGNDSDVRAASKGLAALRSAATSASAAAGQRSGDGAVSSLSRAFDGGGSRNQIGGLGGAGLSGAYAALDAAPVNLKINDPKLDAKKLGEPPASDVAASDMKDSDMAKQLAMSMIGIIVGGAIGGAAGGMVTQIIQQQVQRQEDQARKVREFEEKKQLDAGKLRIGGRT